MPADSLGTGSAETRKLVAIMFTDMVGLSRQLGVDEARRLRRLDAHNRIIRQMVAEHHGSIIKPIDDAFQVDLPSVVHAVQSAQAIHAQLCVPLGNPFPCPSPLAGEGTCA
jgi:adenylate cyclase